MLDAMPVFMRAVTMPVAVPVLHDKYEYGQKEHGA